MLTELKMVQSGHFGAVTWSAVLSLSRRRGFWGPPLSGALRRRDAKGFHQIPLWKQVNVFHFSRLKGLSSISAEPWIRSHHSDCRISLHTTADFCLATLLGASRKPSA